MTGRPRLGPWLWALTVLAATYPWAGFVNHPHWLAIRWHPFDGRAHPIEIGLNVLLYLPGGFLIATGDGSHPRLRACVFALILSSTSELLQLFSHSRVASVVDLGANLTGALVGAMLARADPSRRE